MRRFLPCAAVLLAAGCMPKNVPERQAYFGPTLDLPTLVTRLNERNDRVTGFRAGGSFSADLVDPRTNKHDGGDGDVTLLYTPPRGLRIVGKVFGQRVFDIASNAERYWLILPRQDEMFWGTHAAVSEAGASDRGRAAVLPVRPDVITEVLGVMPIPTDLLAAPAPALRFDNEGDCYAVTFNVRLRDRLVVQKEVRYDRQTLQPRRIELFDANGRSVVRALPSRPMAVGGYTPALELPSRYDLFFAESGSTFTLRFDDIDRERNGVPNARTFVFPADAGVSKVESLDR